jgi:hypothetical protein
MEHTQHGDDTMKPEYNPYDEFDQRYLVMVMELALCQAYGDAPRDVVWDAVDALAQRLIEYKDPWAQVQKELRTYD